MALINYDIDIPSMIQALLGNKHRKVKRSAWLQACLIPIRAIHDLFLSFTNSKMDEIKYNGQTLIMEKMLQAKFGPGIYITNNVGSIDGLFVGDGTDISNFIGTGSDVDSYIDVSYSVALFNFTVNVPIATVFVVSEMEAFIRKYKLFGTTFNIVLV